MWESLKTIGGMVVVFGGFLLFSAFWNTDDFVVGFFFPDEWTGRVMWYDEELQAHGETRGPYETYGVCKVMVDRRLKELGFGAYECGRACKPELSDGEMWCERFGPSNWSSKP